MTAVIFEEWIRWFDNQMTGRKVILLMDNFSAHEAAITNINSSTFPLQNTLVIWLPANSTSRFQPLDQGIIQAWKSHWKRQWARYLVHEFDEGCDPISTMNVLKAIRWGIQAWKIDLKTSSIENCFHKALNEKTLSSPSLGDSDVIAEISKDLMQLQISSRFHDLMDIEQFLNPAEEKVDDGDDINMLDQAILAQFGPDIEAESDEEIEVQPIITHVEALEALSKLRLYQEQQDIGNRELIQALDREERSIQSRKIYMQKQRDIRSYF
jgi:hypothetical protein